VSVVVRKMAEFDWAQAGDLQRADLNAPPQPGFVIRHQHRFTAADISAFATMIGDMNPTHHDAAAAAGAGLSFGQVIATGGHMVSVMMGALSTGMDKLWPNIGLGFSSRFRRAIRAGETTEVTWTVTKVEHQTKLRGLVVSYEGTLTNSAGETALMAQCDVLIPDGKYLA
jgi:3-hydroxybutyryl-CoA dehydratase